MPARRSFVSLRMTEYGEEILRVAQDDKQYDGERLPRLVPSLAMTKRALRNDGATKKSADPLKGSALTPITV